MRLDFPLRRLLFLSRLKKKSVKKFNISKSVRIHQCVRYYIGKKCRALVIGDHSEIRRHTDIEVRGTLLIGSNTVIGVRSFIQADGDITIGDGVLFGPDVKLFSTSHQYGRNHEIHGPLIEGSITIGNNVWIGSGAVISMNTSIGNNSVIGANSFVNRDIPENCVAAGTPAKIIRAF